MNVLLSITDKITDFGPLELVTARILSIILDNAIDETKKTPNKQLELGLFLMGLLELILSFVIQLVKTPGSILTSG